MEYVDISEGLEGIEAEEGVKICSKTLEKFVLYDDNPLPWRQKA